MKPNSGKPVSTMPKNPWRPVPPDNAATFGQMLRLFPEAELRKMFGCPCAFVGGYMFAGLHQENMIFRLSPEDRAAFLVLPGTGPFVPMEGRPMREYVAAPPEMMASQDELETWLARALTFTKTLPPKVKGKR
jgi:TfoX/Sxy family transcriptional regulator of competence genes